MVESGGLDGQVGLDRVGVWLRARLPGLLEECGVPGGAVAVAVGERVVESAAGVLSTATGVRATVDSLFQIGSITKVVTATLIMQLVDEGKLDLDAPVRDVLPEFRIADAEAARRITPRQLLCHVAGFEGDVFTDTGKGDDCVEKYLGALHDVPQLFEPGAMFSYNNAGYCVLGRIVEVVCGEPFDVCARRRLFMPLGMTHTAGDPYEAIVHRAAVGHVERAPGGPLEPSPVWALARSNSPAGSMLAMRPRDLVAFARMHLAEGRGPDGRSVLRSDSVRAMRQPQVTLPDIGQGTAWGLGWELYDTPDGTVVGHDGNTIGQSAFLRLVPERRLALAVLTNGGRSRQVYAEVADRVLGELTELTELGELGEVRSVEAHAPEQGAAESSPPLEASRYAGTYLSSTSRTTVRGDEHGRLWLERIPLGVAADLDELPYRTELVRWRGDTLRPVEPERGVCTPIAFLGDDGEGRALFLHDGRADRRVSS
ncbi:serine hydrolase domain-containing protein [Streptomyces antibioticus]|uniref:Beta-lactamase family protein n=1 Tax=Streptomyces antibioticus TaxID=1890 RepID=A0AAE7CIJ2_STRAT|nr:serine hydrolase domain-containing protein [Streptomyces antibioticus]OOQ54618.1 serine hydrolase [Streptomyces antibioticus]QIT42244.1 beta-lactamase family protein [Streptomyces antibioticus]